VDDLDYDDILAEHRVPIEHRAEPVARATRRILERGLGVTVSRLVYEVMEDRLAVARAAVNSLTIGRDEARAEVTALVEHRATVREGVDAATKQLVSDRSKAEQERDAALDEVARLKAHIAAQTWDADREGPRVPAPVEPSSAATYAPVAPRTVLAEVRAKLDRLGSGEPIPDTVHTTRISHGIAASDVYRRCIQARPSWALILLEEVSEAVEAIGDVTALRAELVQVGAVACAWVEAIDRRQGGAP
jgi:hypothetical protein